VPFSNWTDCCLKNINLPSSEGTFLMPTPRQTAYLSVDQGLGEYVFVHAGRVELGFQGIAAAARERIRLHLDLEADDPEAEVRRLVDRGAVVVEQHELAPLGMAWTVLRDPEGNDFCVSATGTTTLFGGAVQSIPASAPQVTGQ
jgi:predicted enzyme related to lactoylglutathione lyase